MFSGCHKSVCRLVRICVITSYLDRYALNYVKKCQKSNIKILCKQRFFSCSIYQVVCHACQSRSWFIKQPTTSLRVADGFVNAKSRDTSARRVTLRWKSNLVLFSFFLLLLLPDNVVHTKAAIVVQIDLQDSLQTMLEGSFKSGNSE